MECRLCGNQAELQNSHIIPRFVFRWLKQTGATPFLRGAEDPDTRIQDYKEKLLCEDCEQRLSDYEREFATNIFYPHLRDEQTTFEYDEWFQRFIISISWRLIVSDLSEVEELDNYHREAILDAAAVWGDILTDDLPLSADPFSHHVFFFDDVVIEEAPEDMPEKWEWYINRGIDATSVYGKSTAIYFKFPEIAFFSCIQPPTATQLEDMKVERSGEIGPPHTMGPDWGSFLNTRAEVVTSREVSESEREKIKERMMNDLDSVAESESLKTLMKQKDRQITNHNPLDYLNQECPVCYTRHEVVEFLPPRPLRKSEVERMDSKNVLVKGIYMEGELAIEGVPEDTAPTFVLSTEESTRIVSLYTDVGWVVENHVEHPDEVEPREIGEEAWEEKLETYQGWVRKQAE